MSLQRYIVTYDLYTHVLAPPLLLPLPLCPLHKFLETLDEGQESAYALGKNEIKRKKSRMRGEAKEKIRKELRDSDNNQKLV